MPIIFTKSGVSFVKKGIKLPASDNPLSKLRYESGWTQKQVAKKIGCTVRVYGDWERGKKIGDVYYLVELANLFHVSTDYLLGRTKDRNIGNSEITAAIGLSERSIELLRHIKSSADSNDTINFINRELEYTNVQRPINECPIVETVFSLMERFIFAEKVNALDRSGQKTEYVYIQSNGIVMEKVSKLYREYLMQDIRAHLDAIVKETTTEAE